MFLAWLRDSESSDFTAQNGLLPVNLIAALKWYGSIQTTRGVLIGAIWDLATHDIESFFDMGVLKIKDFNHIKEK